MKKLSLACATSAIALLAVPANAQDANPQTDTGPSQATEQASAANGASTADIIVTGSRLARNGSQAPTPVTAVTSQDLVQAAPSSIADALNKLPVFAASSNQNTGGTSAATSSAKGNYLNLRGLGSQRLLTLLNGSRVVPTTNTNAVDTNLLPQLLVSRVDVVTGGASAVYGSDAVTGVVNYVLDEKFEGVKAVAQRGVSTYGDDASYRLGVAGGFSLGNRIHVLASYERYDSDGVGSLNDRPWSHPDVALTGAGTAANPYVQTPMARTSVMSYGGLISTGVLAGQRFLPDGTLTPFVNGARTGSSATQAGGDGIVYTTALAASLKTDQGFLRTSVDLTDDIEFFAQGIYGRSETQFDTQAVSNRPNSNRTLTIYRDNAYLNPAIGALLDAAGQGSFQMGRHFNDMPLMHAKSVTTYWSGQAGLKGTFAGSWGWDVNFVRGRSKLNLDSNELDARRFFASIDAVRDPSTNQVVCRITLTNPGFLPGCVPMNPLGDGNVSAEATAYTRQLSRSQIVNDMYYVNANIHGDLFELPAGPVRIAVGAEYRHQKLEQTSNADPASLATPAQRAAYFGNIRGVPSNALTYLVNNVGQASGSQAIKEVYGELSIPLFKDQPFAQALDLDLAGRVTNYRTSGTVETWKAGLSWTPVRGLRVRATQSRDIAAPSLFDLYAGPNVRNIGVQDPLTNTQNVVAVINQGNRNIDPEKADTTTVGVVFQPAAVPGLTLSIDAYRIKVKGAIQTTSEITQLAECQASGGTAPVCSLIVRPFPYSNTTPANAPTAIYVVPLNLAALTTQGIDFELNYSTSLDGLFGTDAGRLSLRAFANYLDKYDTQNASSQPVVHRAGRTINGYSSGTGVAGGGLPKWRGMLTQTYSQEDFDITFTERFTGSFNRGVTEVFAPGFQTRSPNRTYVDANINFNIPLPSKPQFFINVQNLFNVKPPVQQYGAATGLNAPTDTTIYDTIGRFFTVGVRAQF
ncbi:TonB-dependent receptor [Novosphingobium sp. 11B]